MRITQTLLLTLLSLALLLTGCPIDDRDADGISDSFEDRLLAKYRPFYRFSTDGDDEDQKPVDAQWYVTRSALLSSGDKDDDGAVLYPLGVLEVQPEALLTKPPGAAPDPAHIQCVDTYLSPNGSSSASGLADDGPTWTTIESAGNIGLYGHVTPMPNCPACLQVQYWQFYPYNDAHNGGTADHEGDWELVEVTVIDIDHNLESAVLLSVTHYIHGQPVHHYLGGNPAFIQDDIGLVKLFDRDKDANREVFQYQLDQPLQVFSAQGAHLEMFCENGDRLKCSHPVVYIEHGTHASWPTREWEWTFAPKHGGDSIHRFLTAPPQNLGEVWSPRPSTIGAQLVTQYTGHWGAFSRSLPPFVDTSTPKGPAMHRAWSWGLTPGPANNCLE